MKKSTIIFSFNENVYSDDSYKLYCAEEQKNRDGGKTGSLLMDRRYCSL
jgi:hypothetical protein